MSDHGSALPTAAARTRARPPSRSSRIFLYLSLAPLVFCVFLAADLINALFYNKLRNLSENPENVQHVVETLSTNARKRVQVLREIQGQHDELEAKFFEERAALEAKYQKLYEPLYTKRYDIVNGVVEVEGIPSGTVDGAGEDEEKGVPNFWLNAMKTNEVLANEITVCDEGALKYLKDIKWFKIDDPKGFSIEFSFDSNPYFKNSVLTKTYHMTDDDEHILKSSIGTEIEWYPGNCLTQKVLRNKLWKMSKNAKPVTKMEDSDSFFNFFYPPRYLEDDEDIDEEAVEELQNQMYQDFDIGSTIRDEIVPHAVSWFTGQAVLGADFDEKEWGDGDDMEHESEEDDEEDRERKSKEMQEASTKKKIIDAAELSEGLQRETARVQTTIVVFSYNNGSGYEEWSR